MIYLLKRERSEKYKRNPVRLMVIQSIVAELTIYLSLSLFVHANDFFYFLD